MASRFQSPNEQFFTNATTPDGIIVSVPLLGGKLQFYQSGTSIPQLVFEDSDLTIPRTNPIILDSAGQAGSIFLSTSSPYKVVLEDSDANIIWTEDPVTGSDSSAIPPSGGTLTGTLNFIMGQSVEASTLTNIWTLTDGNSRHITGNGASITSFGTPVQAGQWQRLIFDGSVTLVNSSTLVVPGGENYTTQPGDIFDATTDFSGATLLGPYALANGGTIAGGGGGSSGTVCIDADGRNIVARFLTATTLSLTADEVIAKTGLGGTSYLGSSLTTSLNFGITGANGIDTGAIAASKFYGLYWIYNPTTNVWASLASLNLATPTSLPSGYTAYALIGIIPTNASTAIFTGYNLYGRTCSYQRTNIFTGVAALGTLTTRSIAAAVPPNAKSVTGIIGASTTHGLSFAVASDASGTGLQSGGEEVSVLGSLQGYGSALTFVELQLTTAQTLFWAAGSTGSDPVRLDITGFTI